jgi:triosephosphate isomerase
MIGSGRAAGGAGGHGGRRPLIVGNWKMHGGVAALAELRMVDRWAAGSPDLDIAFALSAPLIMPAAQACGAIAIGAQDVQWGAEGAFKGSVSAGMMHEAGASFTLVGHSERRLGYSETDADIAAKVGTAQAHGLDVVLCIGEFERDGTTSDRIAGLERQLLAGLAKSDPAALAVAYEPVWAIGTGHIPNVETITEIAAALAQAWARRFGDRAARLRLLYGGSVTPENGAALMAIDGIDGLLVGGASLAGATFLDLCQRAVGNPVRDESSPSLV